MKLSKLFKAALAGLLTLLILLLSAALLIANFYEDEVKQVLVGQLNKRSSKPKTPIGPAAMAEFWHRLMHDVLGYERYAAQACDWGSFVTSRLAMQHPESVIAIHLTMLPLRHALKHPSQRPVTAEEAAWIEKMKAWWAREEGYRSIQSTKPMALAFGLMDSPVGLAGWLADKYWRLGDTRKDHPYEGMEVRFPMHTMCTQLSLYWFSGTINSANMLYKAGPAERSALLKPGERVSADRLFRLSDGRAAADATVVGRARLQHCALARDEGGRALRCDGRAGVVRRRPACRTARARSSRPGARRRSTP